MTKRKKNPKDMTTDEIARRVFPRKVRDRLKEIAREKDSNTPAK